MELSPETTCITDMIIFLLTALNSCNTIHVIHTVILLQAKYRNGSDRNLSHYYRSSSRRDQFSCKEEHGAQVKGD